MTLWEVFAPLLRVLSGGRVHIPEPDRSGPPFDFEAEWEYVQATLRLGPRVLRDVARSGSLAPHFHYRHYHKRKKDGGRRDICEPDAKLKQLQQQILSRYLDTRVPHPAAVAYRHGKSTADHVWTHAGAEVVVTADVADFFPSTAEHRVADWWREQVGDDDHARLLTLLTTHRGGLPQGAPTSPALSNLVNFELDERLTRRADLVGARYTRYCDDLAFSWPRGAEPPSDFRAGVAATLLEFGYRLHPEKGWQVYERTDEPEVTGVVLTRNGRIRLPERLKRVMRKLADSGEPHDGQRLAGYKAYEKMMTRRPKPKPAPPPRRPVRQPRPARPDDVPF